eukprot:CAMPEP_0171081946 /NCGR_PEP_ID=MMETSP0766_2-20121228/16811_1 /TAXON_ID=439317 /ORGANISM="Gambierdiscus australes, Strain CAWD 149" /LENGTH=32 /DNA_ID= /DNA_START= /DNA_END= /DNA_ORIENTATION=
MVSTKVMSSGTPQTAMTLTQPQAGALSKTESR